MIQLCRIRIGGLGCASTVIRGGRAPVGHSNVAMETLSNLCSRPLSGLSMADAALSNQLALPSEDHMDCGALQGRFDKLGVHVSSSTCALVLRLTRDGKIRKRIYALIVQSARNFEECLDSLLVQIFIEKKDLRKAQAFAAKLPHLSVLVWNCLVRAYAEQANRMDALCVIEMMQESGVIPDRVTFVNALSACHSPGALVKGKYINHMMFFVGCEMDVLLGTALTTMYSKCGSLEDARCVFDSQENCNVVSWTVMIGAYARNEQSDIAFFLHEQMKQESTLPNRVTYLGLLEACSCPEMLVDGRRLHACCVKDMESDMHSVTGLIHMYGKCGDMDHARDLFELLHQRDTASWNALMGSSVRHERNDEAIQGFYSMLNEGLLPNLVSYVTVLSACACNASSSSSTPGKDMHVHIISNKFDRDSVVATALINMYGKSGRVDMAMMLFDTMEEWNIISWNSIISANAHRKHIEDVHQLLDHMQLKGYHANNVTYVNVLKAYAGEEALPAGKRLHCRIAQSGHESNVVVATALAGMYCRCGKLKDGYRVFGHMPCRNVVSWNTMVSACGQHGRGMQGLSSYAQMWWEGVMPDHITYTSMLSICANQLVLLSLGKHIHSSMMHSGSEPESVAETYLLDMYGKCGSLQDARKVFDRMCKPSVVAWNVMVSNYGQHGYVSEAVGLVDAMQRTGVVPNSVTLLGLLFACSHTGVLVEGIYNSLVMNAHNILPSAEQFRCVIDLLGRAGQGEEAEDFIHKMPLEPSLIAWMTLLGCCCRSTERQEQGEYAARHVFEYDPRNSAARALLASIQSSNRANL